MTGSGARTIAFAAQALRFLVPAIIRHRRMSGGEAQKHLEMVVASIVGTRHDATTVEDMRKALARVGCRLPGGSNCVAQAMAGAAWLSVKGIKPELHYGMKREADGTLAAHAWLTVDGAVATGTPAVTDFVLLDAQTGTRQ